jgi:hypothetical protein
MVTSSRGRRRKAISPLQKETVRPPPKGFGPGVTEDMAWWRKYWGPNFPTFERAPPADPRRAALLHCFLFKKEAAREKVLVIFSRAAT